MNLEGLISTVKFIKKDGISPFMEKTWKWTVGLLVISMCLNIVLFSAGSSLFQGQITGKTVTNIDSPELDLYTQAVCEGTGPYRDCHDEVFVQCGNFETSLGTIVGDELQLKNP